MFQGKLKTAMLAGAAMSIALTTSSCVGGKSNEGQQVYKGSMILENVKVGAPETVFKEAILTFVKDPNPNATAGGKVQYVGRNYSTKGGQYLIQCKGEPQSLAYEVQVYYTKEPVSREEAMETLKQLLPSDAPEQTKVDDSQVKAKQVDSPSEVISFGDAYQGEFVYADKDATKVKIVNAIDLLAHKKAFRPDLIEAEKKAAQAESTDKNPN